MALHSVPESELRDHCKRSIEGLELWLRRFIDQKLSVEYGNDYVDATKPSGNKVIRSEIGRRLKQRVASEPKRFHRPIDAALLDDAIDLICNPELYQLRRPRKFGQGDKWSFCLTAGTLWPANQERP
jgi:hypothetical protein